MSWLSKWTGVHISPKGIRIGGSPLASALTGGIYPSNYDATLFKAQGGDKGNGSPFDPNSPEGMAESGAGGTGDGGFDWSSLLDNPLLLAAGGYGISRLLNNSDYNRAKNLSKMEEEFLKMIMDEQRFRQAGIKPLQTQAFSRLGEKLAAGSGSMLQPGGMPRYELPTYTPGQNVNLNSVRGFRTAGKPRYLG